MNVLFQASIKRGLSRQLTSEEQMLVKKADLEIEFERRRREINYGAPSRLSCIYLVDNDIDGKFILQNMFVGTFKEPKIVEVDILNDDCIVNYWAGIAFDAAHPSWEYLLEGTIQMTNADQINDIEEHVKISFPTEYQAIVKYREDQIND
jgi:hypothetical protein